MLSFIYRLIKTFQREHGLRPNLVYLNRQHYQKLLKSLPTMQSHEEITRFLAMEIVVSPEIAHPHVACANVFGTNLPRPPRSIVM